MGVMYHCCTFLQGICMAFSGSSCLALFSSFFPILCYVNSFVCLAFLEPENACSFLQAFFSSGMASLCYIAAYFFLLKNVWLIKACSLIWPIELHGFSQYKHMHGCFQLLEKTQCEWTLKYWKNSVYINPDCDN